MSVLVVIGYSLRKCTRRSKATLHLYFLSSHTFILPIFYFQYRSHLRMNVSWINLQCSYRPFIPLRNLWSRRDILSCQMTDTQQSNTTQSAEREACEQLHEPKISLYTHTAVTVASVVVYFSVYSPHESKGFLHMCSCSDVSICLRKNTDTSQPVSPVVKTSPTYSCTAPPSPSCSFQYVDLCKIQLHSSKCITAKLRLRCDHQVGAEWIKGTARCFFFSHMG